MAGGGELAAVFRSLAEDAAQAGENIGKSMSRFFEDTADRADASVETTMAAEEANTQAAHAIRPPDENLPAGEGGTAGPGTETPQQARIRQLLHGEGSGEAPVSGQSGGTMRPRDDGTVRSWELDDKWGADAYESIRGADDAGDVAANVRDVPRLDGSTGFTPEEIQTVKNHVFFEEHPLVGENGGTVMSRFDPNSDMAAAWLRLRSGNFKPQDVTLLEHELAENRYWQQHPGVPYPEAHSAANQVANWERDIPEPGREDYSKPWR